MNICRCIDDIELNIATLMFNSIVHKRKNLRFEFRDYIDNKFYYMKICDKDCDISGFNFCEYCKCLNLIKHDPCII